MIGFNAPVIKTLVSRFGVNKTRKLRGSQKPKKLSIELTITQLVVSCCFIVTNIPYFITWLQQVVARSAKPGDTTRQNKLLDNLAFTKTVFCINYCINFFLYCLTGSNYRSVLCDWLSKVCWCLRRKTRRMTSRANGHSSRYDSVPRKVSRSVSLTATTTML